MSAIIYGYDSKDTHTAAPLIVGHAAVPAPATLGTRTATGYATTTASTIALRWRLWPEFV
nr:MAG TPA: hypothetical protein [Caudoviricetes sp.]